mmetsp:Transcript_7077/g.8563  ORF Transcript_7077/g.8563 Transcript_7077/m.8563 type:complete len:131 (-) Transcript_7077:119-511(-)
MLSGVPVVVTGVLLFDQRFWGVRCKELGIGPFPLHINKFKHKSVDIINQAIRKNSIWKSNAVKLSQSLKDAAKGDPAGTKRNANTVVNMIEKAAPYSYAPPSNPVTVALGAVSKMMTRSRNNLTEEDTST